MTCLLLVNLICSSPLADRTQENIVIRVNHDKVAAMLRNNRLIDAAKRRLGRRTAHVYAAVLGHFTNIAPRWMARQEPRPEDEETEEDIPLGRGLGSSSVKEDSLFMEMNKGGAHDDNEDGTGSRSRSQAPSVAGESQVYVNGHCNSSHATEASRIVTPNEIKTSLFTLAQTPHQFVYLDQGSNPRVWKVDFQELAKQLRREEALRLAGSRLSGVALRLIRVLLDKGKLDEKFLQEISLLSAKDLRQCLAKLKLLGFLGLQEVPREPQRQPNRTIFLWVYDSDRVRRMLLVDLYKIMARLFRRLKAERHKVAALLEKAERTDVKGKEDKLLGSGEIEVLKAWRRKEEWLLVELDRLDDSVAVLRDI